MTEVNGDGRHPAGWGWNRAARLGLRVAGGVGVALVVGGLRAARRRAEESEERFRLLAEGAAEGVALIEDGRIVDANETLAGMLGTTVGGLVGAEAVYFVAPEHRTEARRRVSLGSTEPYEARVLRADGGSFWAGIRPRPASRGGREEVRLVSVLDLTGRRSSEAALRQSEALYRAVVEQAAENIFLVDAGSGRILQANPAFRASLGYTEREMRGLRLHDVVAVEPSVLDESVRRILAGERFVGERRYRRKDGTLLDVEVSASAISYGDGEAVCIVAHDVTERKRYEQELRRSEASLLAAQRISHLGDWEYALHEDRGRWSDELFRIFGFEPRAFVPSYRAFFDMVHPDDRRALRRSIFGALREEGETVRGSDVGYRIVRRDGEVRHVDTHYEVESDGSGRAVRMYGTVQDVTERRGYERRLREAETRFRTLVEQIPAVTYVEAVDHDGRSTNLLYASPQIEEMFGYSPEEWTADPDLFPRLLHPEDRERVLALDERTDETGEPFVAEYRQYTRDGRVIWVRDEAVLVRDAAGEPLFWQGVMFDVTEQKRYEEELERRAEELRRSNAELEQFAYVASHDLQEPLRMVSSYTQLLRRRYEGRLDEEADEFIGYAVEGAERMRRLIDDLLAYSRVGTRGRPLAPTSTAAALEGALANLKVAIEESAAEIEAPGEMPVVVGDHTQLVQLFQNLVGNALKFVAEPPARVRIGVELLGGSGEWLFSVSDNGIGIERGSEERIFVIFQRLHDRSRYGGTGIGLALCKKIVERHGGRIRAESEGVPGRGSTFYFTLKAAEGPHP